jgi:hypothetical protein
MIAVDQLRAQLGGRYTIERELGRGGMGTVYLAHDVRLARPVALKVLPSEFAAQPALRERFLRETRTAAGFSHPNIVPVYAIEEGDDLLAYVMGFIEGESLAERIARAGPLGPRETARLLQDVGYALAYAHGRGVVHRDIKPDNVMIERATGRALVMDFGIARSIQAPAEGAGAGLTRVGEIVGTPEYMSPEQATGDVVDGRSDLYSLGLTAYFALTGATPMSAETTGKVLARQITERLPSLHSFRADIPTSLSDAIDRCLAKDPSDRFERAEGLVEELDAAQLRAPEIPVPIRLFAQEAGTSSLLLVFTTVLTLAFLPPLDTTGRSTVGGIVPIVLLFGVLLTRLLQTLSEARRLTLGGFTVADIQHGMQAVVDERERRRVELQADERTRRARRRTLISAGLQLALAVAMIAVAGSFRTPVPGAVRRAAPAAVVLVGTAAVLFGVSMVLVLRSPFRMPIGERAFRRVWIGPFGRAFLRFAARGSPGKGQPAATAPTARTTPARVPTASRAPAPSPSASDGDRLRALEQRILELERRQRDG